MARRRIIIGRIVCFLIAVFVGQSFSQVRRPRQSIDFERRMKERQVANKQRVEQMEKIKEQYVDQAYREAIGADENQWKTIKPRLERVKKLKDIPSLGISVYGGTQGGGSGAENSKSSYSFSTTVPGGAGGGAGPYPGVSSPMKKQQGDMSMGWTWKRLSLIKNRDELTEAKKTCEQLLELLETNNSSNEQIEQKVGALRKVREKDQEELAKARQELREVVTLHQEAKLVLMGILD